MKTRLLETKAEREERARRQQIWNTAGIPERFRDFTLDTSPVSADVVASMRPPDAPVEGSIVEEAGWSAWRHWADSWFIWGAYGTGKTGLAVGYMLEWLRYVWGQDVMEPMYFRTVPRLLTELRATYGSEGESEMEVLERYGSASLLVLDDFGAEHLSGSGWAADRLYQIIGERHDNLRPIVFTSNLSLEQLAQRIGERVTWRILEMCGKDHLLHVEGKNLRL